jgi:hypothetical protein
MRALAIGCIFAGGLLALASAQGRTWIVDVANPPGTDFTDLPPAIAAAVEGDRVLVRTGLYTGFRTGKSLTILGDGTVRVRIPVDSLSLAEIVGLPAGATFAIENVGFEPAGGNALFGGLRLTDNAGRVHFEEVRVESVMTSLQVGAALVIQRCAQVTIGGGRLAGFPGLLTTDSVVSLNGVDVVGGSACSGSLCASRFPSSGISLTRGFLLLSGTNVQGGNGVQSLFFMHQPKPAITAVGGTLRVTGDATTTIAAGQLIGGNPTPAIAANGSAIWVDPTPSIRSAQGGPLVDGPATIVVERLASLSATGAPPGGTAFVELVSPSGDAFLVAASRPADLSWLPWGALFVDSAVLAPVAVGTQGPTERFPFSIPVPGVPALTGAAVAFQAVSVAAATGSFQLSNPAVVVLH